MSLLEIALLSAYLTGAWLFASDYKRALLASKYKNGEAKIFVFFYALAIVIWPIPGGIGLILAIIKIIFTKKK